MARCVEFARSVSARLETFGRCEIHESAKLPHKHRLPYLCNYEIRLHASSVRTLEVVELFDRENLVARAAPNVFRSDYLTVISVRHFTATAFFVPVKLYVFVSRRFESLYPLACNSEHPRIPLI